LAVVAVNLHEVAPHGIERLFHKDSKNRNNLPKNGKINQTLQSFAASNGVVFTIAMLVHEKELAS
jgi:hypothetical protein